MIGTRTAVLFPLLLVSLIVHPAAQLPSSLADPGETLQLVRGGLNMTEGPAADSAGTVYFTEPFQNTLWRVPLSGDAHLVMNNTQGANGLVFDQQNRMILCEIDRVSRLEPDSSFTPLATFTGRANDLSLCADGGMFFTEPDWNTPANGDVYYLPASGSARKVLVAETGFPNGIEYIEEQRMLYVAISRQNVVRRYPVAQNMDLGQPDTFVSVQAPDGFALDEHGNFWIAGNSTAVVYVYDPAGQALGQLSISGQSSVTNCAFGGLNRDILFVTGGSAVYKIQTKVRGRSTTGAVGTRTPRRGLAPRGGAEHSRWSVRTLTSPAARSFSLAQALFAVDGRVRPPWHGLTHAVHAPVVSVINCR
jgi:gluconolactonase